eukprot:3913790-Rhodomonas_salina.1
MLARKLHLKPTSFQKPRFPTTCVGKRSGNLSPAFELRVSSYPGPSYPERYEDMPCGGESRASDIALQKDLGERYDDKNHYTTYAVTGAATGL